MLYRLSIQVTTHDGTTYITAAGWTFETSVTREAINKAERELTEIQNVRRTTILSWSPLDNE
jgi:hypothetical protein